jgi:hypothetical protein
LNPFELIGQFEEFKKRAAEVLEGVEPGWILRAGAAMLVKFVLESAKHEGPPANFAEKLHLEPDQARVLYNTALEAALTRK